jgi:hypothetical protein
MRREESPANPDADGNVGSGESSPGDRAYDEESLVGDDPGAEVAEDPEAQSDG